MNSNPLVVAAEDLARYYHSYSLEREGLPTLL
jgi:hypothetical protein